MLQEAQEALLIENRETLRWLEILRNRKPFLKRQIIFIKVKYRKSQTSSSNDGNLSCNGCTFIVKYMWCQESLYEFIFLCNICRESFNAMWEMMADRKKKLLLNFRPCKYYIHGACELDAKSYCFRHEHWEQNSTLTQTI